MRTIILFISLLLLVGCTPVSSSTPEASRAVELIATDLPEQALATAT